MPTEQAMRRQRITQAHDEWLDLNHSIGVFSKNTVINYRNSRSSFTASQGDLPIRKVARKHVKAWMASFGGLAPSTVNGRLSALHSFYEDMLKEDKVESNPFAGFKRPKGGAVKKREPAPPEATAKLILTAEPRARLMIALAVYLGLRRFEIAKLRVDDFDFEQLTVSVLGKGRKMSTLPVPPFVAAMVADFVEDTGTDKWLFPSVRGGHLGTNRTGQIMTDASNRVGVRITPHQYRHRAGTDVAKASDLKMAQMLLRHTSSATTDQYLHMDLDDLRAALDGMYGNAA